MKNLKLVLALAVGMLIGSAGTAFAASTGAVQALFAEFNLVINGKSVTLDTTPLVYEGTSYLPVRNMANLFGYDVTYKADSRTIELNTATGATYGPTPAPGSADTTPVIRPTTQVINQNSLMGAQSLINVLSKKYPDDAKNIRLVLESGLLFFGGKEYQLLIDEAQMKYDVTPLIEASILQASDIT